MNNPSAFKGTYVGWRYIATRGAVVISIECPDSDAAYQALGGMPVVGQSIWLGIARLEERKVMPHSPTSGLHETTPLPTDKTVSVGLAGAPKSYAQDAGKWCADPEFQQFLEAANAEAAAEIVREICGVKSRKEILEGTPAAAAWSDLVARFEIERRA